MKIYETSGVIPEKVALVKINTFLSKDEYTDKSYPKGIIYDEVVTNGVVINNDPIDNVRFILNDSDNYFGKIVVNDDFFTFTDHNFLFNCLKYNGIKKNGILNGKYRWVKKYYEYSLVETSSKLFKALERSTARKNNPIIQNISLKPGSVYVTDSGACRLFIGPIKTLINRNIKKQRYVNRLLWLKLNTNDDPLVKLAKLNELKPWAYTRELIMSNRHSFIEEIGSLNLKKDVIESLRKTSIKILANNPAYQNSLFEYCHMHDPNDVMPPAPEYAKLIALL